ncbi:hypothetical protein CD30_13030 [Ureibacillus massiliensis 4400831 = CIP 108448 = CCUG 49529]|uniref:SF3 helicase domain-containing protein n=1 Tax=Ureibacillus massiliensis 4400831 = CIP 108448 = CCUG 49529 TaxID=1211035 RepID=A0A0A3IZF7_9BACL|nr:phage/plasmid primase, P4 family [Ureibacillus massiliensis]KGR90169.1 hypothetical protein CD30_13030 [Ureibacillus massiliensis 4400831 = CIP 108448 = CCUG 49529]
MANALRKNDDSFKYFNNSFKVDGQMVGIRKNMKTSVIEAFLNGDWIAINKEDLEKEYRVDFNYPYRLEFSYNGGKTWWVYNDEKYMSEWEREYFNKQVDEFSEWELKNAIALEEARANDPAYWERLAEEYEQFMQTEAEYYRSKNKDNDSSNVIDISDIFKNDDTPSWRELSGEDLPDSKNVRKQAAPNYEQYFEIMGNSKKFQPIWYGKDILENRMQAFYDGTYLYRYDNGVYVNDGEAYLRQISTKLLDDEYRKNRVNEVRHYIESYTYTQKTDVNNFDDYINLKNGLLNWKTGELVEHTPDRLSTIQFPITYDPKANDPIVMDFINSVLEKDTHLTLFEMIGYFLTPTTEYEKIFLFTGTGSNGKSVLINTIEAMLGKSNISKVKLQDLEGDRSRFKIAELYGKVLNCFTDIPNNMLTSTGNLKVIASGEGLNAEKKGKDPFDFEPFCKLLFSANELPKTNDNSNGFFRRMMVFPFTRIFTEKERDTKLIQKLTTPEALSTLFNYALAGLQRLDQQGQFTASETITDQVKSYQKESDVIMLFIEEECVIGNDPISQTPYKIERKELHNIYVNWCKENGYKSESAIAFNKQVESKFKDKIHWKKAKKGENSVPFWFGIKA